MRQTFIDILLGGIMVAIAAVLIAVSDRGNVTPTVAADAPGPVPRTLYFATVDVYVDPAGTPMAGYQVEITPRFEPGTETTFVSFSGGGTHPAFRDPPHYDSKALNVEGSRLILADLSTNDDLPREKTRVAQIDVAYTGALLPKFVVTPVMVCGADARKIEAAAASVTVLANRKH